MSRIWPILAYPALPGQLVLPTSRWAKMFGSFTAVPREYLVYEVPSE